MKKIVFFLAVMASFFVFGCSSVTIKPFQPDNTLEAGLVLERLKKTNHGLVNFKCSGSIDVKNDNSLITARAVMCIKPPRSFRLEALSPAGQPAFRMSGNANSIHIQPEPDSRIYEGEADGATLEKLAGIEIKVDDLIEIMCGRPAQIPKDSILGLRKDETGKSSLFVYSPDGILLQKLLIDEKMKIYATEVFDPSGNPLYSAEFSGKRDTAGFSFPSRIFIKAGQRQMKLSLRQIWPNTDVSEDLFVLTTQPGGVKE